MVLWRNTGCPVTVLNIRVTRGIPKGYRMGPRELVETSFRIRSVYPSPGSWHRQEQKVLGVWSKIPKGHQLLWSMSAVQAFHWAFPSTFLALGSRAPWSLLEIVSLSCSSVWWHRGDQGEVPRRWHTQPLSRALAKGVPIVGMTFGPDVSAFLSALESLGNLEPWI